MRFGSGISKIWSALAAMFASAPRTRRSSVMAQHDMRRLAGPVEPVRHRTKCGGPNWLKMAINSQKRH